VRIPGINQTGVPGAEQLSLGAISSAAQGKMRVSQALTKVVDDYNVMSNKAEAVAEYGQHYESSLMAMDANYDDMINQPHYDADSNPTYRGLEEQWNKSSMKFVTEKLNGFTNKAAKSKYQEDIGTYLRGKANDMRGVIRKRQVDYSTGVLNFQIETFKTQPGGAKKTTNAIMDQVQLGNMDLATGQALNQKSLENYASTQLTMAIESAGDDGDLDAITASLLENGNPYLTLQSIQNGFTSIRQKEAQIDKDIEQGQADTYEAMLIKVVLGDLTSQTDVDLALSGTNINARQFDDLTKRLQTDMKGPEVDNWSEYRAVSLNLEQYSAVDILTNTMLTRPTRIKLVAELGKLNDETDKDLDWVSSQSGREAKRRIMAAFVNKTPLAKAMGVVSAEADEVLTELYSAISAIPAGKQQSSVLSIANGIIARRQKENSAVTESNNLPDSYEEIATLYPPGEKRKEQLMMWQKKNGFVVPASAFIINHDDALQLLEEKMNE